MPGRIVNRHGACLVLLGVTAALLTAPPGLARHIRGGYPAGPVRLRSSLPVSGMQSGEGVVQSVSTKAVVVRQLDGTTLTVPTDSRTVVFIDGRRAGLGDVEPGYVLAASWIPGKPVTVLRFLRSG